MVDDMLATLDETMLIDSTEVVEGCIVEVGIVDVDSTEAGVDTGIELERA